MVGRRPSEHDIRCTGLLCVSSIPVLARSELTEDSDAVSTNLRRLEDVDVAGFFWGGCADAGERCNIGDTSYAAEVEFGEDFENGDVEAIEVV
jgi:hypothetical protein